MVVDFQPDRLAEAVGAIPVDKSKGDPVQQVLEMTGGTGADCGCEAVGYQCRNRKLRDLITTGKAKPSVIISHQISLAKRPKLQTIR